MTQRPTCKQALTAFVERRLAEWTGLPPGCRLDDLTASAPLANEGIGSGVVGGRPLQYRMVVASGYPRPVRAWLDGDALVILDAEYPDPTGRLVTEIERLGEPEARLDTTWEVLELRGAEWVYPSRGIAAFVNPDNRIVLRLVGFGPTTLPDYLGRLRLSRGYREH